MVYFYYVLHTYACQHSLTTGMRTLSYLINIGLLCNCPASKILIPLELYEIFESYFAYLFILILSSHTGMHMGDKGLLSINLVVQSKIVLCIICDNKCTPEMWKKLKSFW